MAASTSQQFLQNPLPHALCKGGGGGGGHRRRQGAAEGARVVTRLEQRAAALRSWLVSLSLPRSSSVTLGEFLRARRPASDRGAAIPCSLDA